MQIRMQGNRYQFIRDEIDAQTQKRRQTVFLSLPRSRLPVEADVRESMTLQEFLDFREWRHKKSTLLSVGDMPVSLVNMALRSATEAIQFHTPSDDERAAIEHAINQLELEMLGMGYEP